MGAFEFRQFCQWFSGGHAELEPIHNFPFFGFKWVGSIFKQLTMASKSKTEFRQFCQWFLGGYPFYNGSFPCLPMFKRVNPF